MKVLLHVLYADFLVKVSKHKPLQRMHCNTIRVYHNSSNFLIDKPRAFHSSSGCSQQGQDSGGTSHRCPLAPPADTVSSYVSFAFLHHCPTVFTWFPFISLQPFNQFQWYPGPGPYLTWGTSPALLGPTHGPWSSMGKQMRCHQHKVSVQPLVLLVSTSTLTFSAREPQQSCKRHKVRHLLLPQGYSLSNITNPVPTCIKEDMNIQESLKDKCCLISYSLLNSEMIFMSHKWDIYFISQVIGGNNICRTHFT